MSAHSPILSSHALADAALSSAGHPPLIGRGGAALDTADARGPAAGAVQPTVAPTGGAVAGRALLALLRQG